MCNMTQKTCSFSKMSPIIADSYKRLIVLDDVSDEHEQYLSIEQKALDQFLAQDIAKKRVEVIASTSLEKREITVISQSSERESQTIIPEWLKQSLISVEKSANRINRMFDGFTSQERIASAKEFIQQRKTIAEALFKNVVRPEIERLLKKHGESRPFDEVVCIFGFNRLFTKDVGSAGSDVDFMAVIDTRNEALIKEFRVFMKEIIRPELQKIGIDMECADYLMIDLPSYSEKLSDTRSSLFTLANMPQEKNKKNVSLITGSPGILKTLFTFSDEQLAEHYSNLLCKNHYLSEEGKSKFKRKLIANLAKPNATSFRERIIDHLQRMANSELYIGNAPYFKKQTIQTIMQRIPSIDIKNRSAPFSIKFCVNRIIDLMNSTTLDSTSLSPLFSHIHFAKLEALGTILSNIVCRLDSRSAHPLLSMQHSYADITLEQLKRTTKEDREVLATLLLPFQQDSKDIVLDPHHADFPEKCYDKLWKLAQTLDDFAKKVEKKIFTEALVH